MAFPIGDKAFIKADDYHERVSYALSQQLKEFDAKFIIPECEFLYSSICGEPLDEANKIIITITKSKEKVFYKNGKYKTPLKVFSVVPSAPFIRETAQTLIAEATYSQIMKEMREERNYNRHMPNMAEPRKLFEAVAQGILLDKKISKKTREVQMVNLADALSAHFSITKDWPLEISGRIDSDFDPTNAEKLAKQVDCSDWMLFTQNKSQNWTIRAMKSDRDVKAAIESTIRHKITHTIVAIHKLEPVPYSLMADGDWGPILIDKKDAEKYKQVSVVWRNFHL